MYALYSVQFNFVFAIVDAKLAKKCSTVNCTVNNNNTKYQNIVFCFNVMTHACPIISSHFCD